MSKELLVAADLSGLPGSGLVVVGFSGGADSMALAHWLAGKVDSARIVLAHVNHMLRGEEAERDEAAAREFARRTGLRFIVSKTDVKALAKQKGMGLEECGRTVRYDFFESLAPGENDRILTAHNADDNAETVLLNLCRGAGLDGLCGIPHRRGKILRPFLKVSREEIEEYCCINGLPFVTDSSNLSGEFVRNRVRLEVMPVLRELNPRFVEAVSQAAELLGRDREFLREGAERLIERAERPYGMDAAALLDAPEAVSARALKVWLERQGCGRLEKKHLDEVRACLENGGAAQLPGGVTVRRAQGILSAVREGAAEPFSLAVRLPRNFGEAEKMRLPGGKVLILEKKQVFPEKNGQKIHNLLFKNALDYDIITRTLVARTRREGDRFSPAGGSGSKSLKQVFQECSMPAGLRNSAVLLECAGKLAWCEGAGASREFQVTERTCAVLAVTLQTQGNEKSGGKV